MRTDIPIPLTFKSLNSGTMDPLHQLFVEKMKLSHEHFDEFMQVSKTVPLRKKDYLIKENTICSFMGFVETGVLRSILMKDGDEYTSDFFFPGSFVCVYTSFLSQSPAMVSIQAISPATIRCISHSKFNERLAASSEWYKLGKYIADSFFFKKCKRETSLLQDSATERFKFLLETFPGIEQSVSQRHIASYLGIKPESLSRIKALTYINK
jgi:CRP-like cAMP-binding protein